MDRPTIHAKLQQIIRDFFDDPAVVIQDFTTAKDIKGWDSITHIDLVCCVEDEFKIKILTREVATLANVGEFIDLIQRKTAR
ncbi:MAG TPA: acyl carrier protein [Chthoniobacteraceae bacterium]|jgi:acyl carrier protein